MYFCDMHYMILFLCYEFPTFVFKLKKKKQFKDKRFSPYSYINSKYMEHFAAADNYSSTGLLSHTLQPRSVLKSKKKFCKTEE